MPGPSEPLLHVGPCQPAWGGGSQGQGPPGGLPLLQGRAIPPTTCPPGLYLAVPCSPVLSCLALV